MGNRGWVPLAVVALILVVLLPICCVLSVGPAYALYDNGYLPYDVLEAYRPLLELCQRSEWASDTLDSYIFLWRGDRQLDRPN